MGGFGDDSSGMNQYIQQELCVTINTNLLGSSLCRQRLLLGGRMKLHETHEKKTRCMWSMELILGGFMYPLDDTILHKRHYTINYITKA